MRSASPLGLWQIGQVIAAEDDSDDLQNSSRTALGFSSGARAPTSLGVRNRACYLFGSDRAPFSLFGAFMRRVSSSAFALGALWAAWACTSTTTTQTYGETDTEGAINGSGGSIVVANTNSTATGTPAASTTAATTTNGATSTSAGAATTTSNTTGGATNGFGGANNAAANT